MDFKNWNSLVFSDLENFKKLKFMYLLYFVIIGFKNSETLEIKNNNYYISINNFENIIKDKQIKIFIWNSS